MTDVLDAIDKHFDSQHPLIGMRVCDIESWDDIAVGSKFWDSYSKRTGEKRADGWYNEAGEKTLWGTGLIGDFSSRCRICFVGGTMNIFETLDRYFASLPKVRLNDYLTWDEIPLGTKFDIIGLEPYPNPVVKLEHGFFTRDDSEFFAGTGRPSSPSQVDDDWIIVP